MKILIDIFVVEFAFGDGDAGVGFASFGDEFEGLPDAELGHFFLGFLEFFKFYHQRLKYISKVGGTFVQVLPHPPQFPFLHLAVLYYRFDHFPALTSPYCII